MSSPPLFLVLDRTGKKQSCWLAKAPPSNSRLVTLQEPGIHTAANDVISRSVRGIDHPVWRLEIAKYAEQHSAHSIAVAQALFDGAGNTRDSFHIQVKSPNSTDALHAVGVLCKPGGVKRLVGHIRLVIAFLAGFLVNLLLVLKHSNRSQRSKGDAPAPMIAVHAEHSNRTRHVLPPKLDLGDSPVFVLLGRPRMPLIEIAKMLDPDDSCPKKTLIRPVSTKTVFAATPQIFRHLSAGLELVGKHPVRLPFRALVAIAFRFALGATQAEWWRQSALQPLLVVFGHTGLADTIQLEQAMQHADTKTIHYAHGVSHGWNFAGTSDLGLFNSKHDAELAARIGGYPETGFIPKVCPSPADRDNRNWLVLTSCSHPMNPAYLRNGVAPDIEVLDRVAGIAQTAGPTPKKIVWRPHPALYDLSNADQVELRSAAQTLGFVEWPERDAYRTIGNYSAVFSTPSTSALDALGYGKNPILVPVAPMQRDSVYAQMTNINDLANHSIEQLSSPEEMAKTWDRIKPGRSILIAQDLQKVQLIKQ